MADERNQNQNRNVDEAGIRLAPVPIKGSDYYVLPSIRQEFVLEPALKIDEPNEVQSEFSTADDFQPKVKDRSKKWKRVKRGKNILFGVIMLVCSMLVVLPYILAAAGQTVGMPFKYVPEELNAIGNLIKAFQASAEYGWQGAEVQAVWLGCIPSLVLLIGLIFVVVNIIKSLFAIIGAVRPVRYIVPSVIYLVTTLVVLVFYLIGINALGIEQINILDDFILAYSTSELFAIVVVALVNLIISLVCTFVNRDKLGYIR